MRNFIEKNTDKKTIISTLISAFIIFIGGVIYENNKQTISVFFKDTLSEWIFNALTFSINFPLSILILFFLLAIISQKVITRYLLKTKNIFIPEWIITANKSNPQWAEYKEINLDNQCLKSMKMTLKIRSNFMRFGFKFLDENANILNNSVLGNDNYILVHIGKQIDNNDLAFVSFKKGVKDLQDTKFAKLNNNSEVTLKVKFINKHNFKFYVNNKVIYTSYIETPLRKRFVLMAWSNQNEYELIAEDIDIITEN